MTESLTGGTSPDTVTLGDTGNTVTVVPLWVLTPDEILAQIAAWEAKQARPIREFTLSGNWDTKALARINMIDDEIRRLRAML
jgi:hypothetical protein